MFLALKVTCSGVYIYIYIYGQIYVEFYLFL